MGSEKRDELDRLIDSVLVGYVDAEPLAGLEQRVLERVRLAHVGRRSRVWWGWTLAAVATAAAVLVIAERPRPVRPLVGQSFRPAELLPRAPAQNLRQAERPAPQKQKARNLATQNRLPKRDQFPTPAPLTAEERALIQLAGFDSPGLQSPAELSPIEIAPIEIAPLRIDQER
jgi:hypothetical protein